jgi:pyrroline-5-carboxylate reductase
MNALDRFCDRLGFLGAGNMAGALMRGAIVAGAIEPDRILACDVIAATLETLKSELGIGVAASSAELLDRCRIVVLAVKPQQMGAALDAVRDRVRPEHLLISIAAGQTCARLAERLPQGTRLVRVMPNTPSLVGRGAAGVAAGPHARPEDVQAALALMRAIGIAVEVSEPELDAVTALSGSGPAYIFRIIELMREAGVEMGLSLEVARELTLQTVAGAAALAIESGVDPAELRRRVTSPGGTTAAALEVMDERGMGDIFKAALHRARERSRELAG